MGSRYHLVLLAAILTVCCICTANAAAQESVDKVLATVDSKDFVDSLFGLASGASGVEFQAQRLPEIRYLVEHSAEAIPKMLQRLEKPNGIRYRLTPIVYFIVFHRAKDPRVLPFLADYLDSFPIRDEQNIGSYVGEESPFIYAIAASTPFIPVPRDVAINPVRDRHKIAQQLRDEFKRRSAEIGK